MAAADHLEGKLSHHAGGGGGGGGGGGATMKKAAPTTTTIVTGGDENVDSGQGVSGAPVAPSLKGLQYGGEYVPRHHKVYKTKLKDLSGRLQASHPIVRGVAVYCEEGVGGGVGKRKWEVDVGEYVGVLNEEIGRLRGVVRELEGEIGGLKERKRRGTFLRGRGGGRGGGGFVGREGSGGSVGRDGSGGGAVGDGNLPVLEAKPVVGFPKAIGTTGGGGGGVNGGLPVLAPKPAVSFPGPARPASSLPGKSAVGSTTTMYGRNTGVSNVAGPNKTTTTIGTRSLSGSTRNSASVVGGKDKKKKDDAVAAALSAVETFELKKPATITSTRAKAGTKKKVATLRGKDVDRRVKEITKKVGTKGGIVKPKQQEVASSTVPTSTATVVNPQRASVKGERGGGGMLGAGYGKSVGGAGRKLKKSFSFIHRGNSENKMRRTASVSKLDKNSPTSNGGGLHKEHKMAVEKVRIGVVPNGNNTNSSTTKSSHTTPTTTAAASVPAPTPVVEQPIPGRKSSGRRRMFSTFIRGKR